MRKRLLQVLGLQLIVGIYTLSGVAAKFASNYEFLSWGFICCYGIEILILGIYAILWQQIIKRLELSIAYANRSISLLWSMLWAIFFFQETISFKEIIGVIIVIMGTMIVNREERT